MISATDAKIAKIKASIDFHQKRVALYESILEDPSLIDVLIELSHPELPPATARVGRPRRPPAADDHHPSEEYKEALLIAILEILGETKEKMDSKDLYSALKESGFELRPRNDSPKGLGKPLGIFHREGKLKRTEDRRYFVL
jgi:hypothetical protein